MSRPTAPSAAPSCGSGPSDDEGLRLSRAFSACAPARGLRSGPVTAVAVDDDLVWVTPVPAVAAGATRASSPTALLHLGVLLAQELAAAQGGVQIGRASCRERV